MGQKNKSKNFPAKLQPLHVLLYFQIFQNTEMREDITFLVQEIADLYEASEDINRLKHVGQLKSEFMQRTERIEHDAKEVIRRKLISNSLLIFRNNLQSGKIKASCN